MNRTFPLLLALPPLLAGCSRPAAVKPAPTAEKPHVESELARTTLSAEQAKEIVSKAVKPRRVQEQMLVSGRLMVPQGREVTIAAPVSGYVRAPGKKGVPIQGLEVEEKQPLFLLEPVLAPIEKIQMATLKRGVENELAKAREGVTVAEADVERMTDLHRQKLRSQQDLEQARARHKNAQEDVESARDKLALFARADGAEGDLGPLVLRAPLAGTVLSAPVSPGQYVTATTPLMTIADLSKMWVRVSVPEADLPRIDRKGAASVLLRAPSATLKERPPVSVKPLALVPQVDVARHVADLIYLLPSDAAARGLLAKDQLVTVSVPLAQRLEETMVPYDAVVFDAHAGAWVYLEKSTGATHVYERRRVELGPVEDREVAIRPGLASGERVVVAGAGVLFSREFYKVPQKK